MWPLTVLPPRRRPPQARLLLILSELAEGGSKQFEPFKKVPEEILQACPPATLYRQLRGSPVPCWAAKGFGERGEARGLGEGGRLSLVLPCREDAEGNRPGECRIKCLWQTEHNLAKPTKI